MKTNRLIASAAAALMAISSCNAPLSEADIRAEHQADSILNILSPEQKIAQLFVMAYDVNRSDSVKLRQNEVVAKGLGGLIIMDGSLIPMVERMNEFNRIAEIPLLVTIDGEWGASMRYPEVPSFPRQMQLGALSSDTLVYKMGYLIGRECRELGMHVNFAPDVDINNNPDNPVINTRSFGEDKEKVARFGAAYMLGMKEAGVAGSAKHFPGHGDTGVDSHHDLPTLDFSRERLEDVELYPFRHLIKKGVDMVMVGHLNVPALDDSGTPSSLSKPIVTDLLKKKMGFDGIVVTDALGMKGVSSLYGYNEIPLMAYKAGADILLMAEDDLASMEVIQKALDQGEITMESLDEKVRKILLLKARLGLFDAEPHFQIDTTELEKRVVRPENLALIDEIAEKTMTAIGECPALPLSQFEDASILCISYGDNKETRFGEKVIKYKGASQRVDTLSVAPKMDDLEKKGIEERLSAYDHIILGVHNTSPRPHENFGLIDEDMNFFTGLAAEQKISMVYFGSPYAIDKINDYKHFETFIIAYSNTGYNAEAAAKVLMGACPPLGVLPVTPASL